MLMGMMTRTPRILARLAITAALLSAMLYAIGPQLRGFDLRYYQYGQEARAESSNIQDVGAQDLNQMLKSQHKPTLVLMYASWCPYCQKQIPDLLSLKQHYKDKIAFIFISIDQSKAQLADYLLKHHANDGFSTYHMPDSEFSHYQTFFKQFGANFRGGIPYMGLFDATGDMVLEVPGLAPKDELKAAMDEVLSGKKSATN